MYALGMQLQVAQRSNALDEKLGIVLFPTELLTWKFK